MPILSGSFFAGQGHQTTYLASYELLFRGKGEQLLPVHMYRVSTVQVGRRLAEPNRD
jgi:hypothetical protein